MNELTEYKWWGTDSEPPPNLKSKNQLKEQGLVPVKAVGIVYTKRYNMLLYDINNPESCRAKKPCRGRQLEALNDNRQKAVIKRKYREWYDSQERLIEEDRIAAVRWAREELSKDDWVILDTETTGLDRAEIVEIAIISHAGETLLNTLIKPTISIPADAAAIHGITDEMVADAPNFPKIYPEIVRVLEGKRAFIYNAVFDIKILNYCRNLHKLASFNLSKRYECIMTWHAQWAGHWSDYHESYKWHPLCGGHRALDDCLAALERIKKMADDDDSFHYPMQKPE